jgi:HEAT repeat protein
VPDDDTPAVEGLPRPIRTRAGTLRFVHPILRGSVLARDRLLAALAETPSASLRAAIVEALPRTSQGWEPALLRLLEHDPDETVRKLCAASLRFGAEPARIAGALRALADPAPAVRAEAALLASRVSATSCGSSGLAARLMARLDDHDRRVRAMAARTLGMAGLTRARPALARLSRDPNPAVRREAARALRRLP